MGLEPSVREKATKATCLLVDGQSVDPWLVNIDLVAKCSTPLSVELRLGVPILVFELQQCEVNVRRDNILAFILDDMKGHRDEALNGYLTIVRHVVNAPPRRKSLGWLARMFTSPPRWTPPTPNWRWTRVSEISLSDQDTLIIKGECCKIAVST